MSAPPQAIAIPTPPFCHPNPATQCHVSGPFQASLAVVFILDAREHFVYVSKASAPVWGYTPEELQGVSCLDIVAGQTRPRTKRYFDRLKAGTQVPGFENYFRKKDGSATPVSWLGRWDALEERFYFVVYKSGEQKAVPEEKDPQQKEITGVLERITDGFFSVDADWQITYWNKKAASILHKPTEEVLGKNIWACYPEVVGSVLYWQYHKAMEEQVSVHFEYYLPTLDLWFDINAYPSQNGLSVFFMDITALKQTESELRKLSLIARQTINVVLITTPGGIITWVNDAFTRVSGYSYEEAVGKLPHTFFVGPETDPNTVRYIRERWEKGQELLVEIMTYTKEGKTYWSELQGQPLLDDKGQLQQYFFMGTDITERKRSEDQLRKLSLLARETENIVLMCNAEGKISWANDALIRKTGYTLEEALGKYPPELFHGPLTDSGTVQYINECLGAGKPCRVEILDYTKSRETFWSEVYIQPIKDASGRIEQYFAIQTNITERKRLQEKLEQQQRQRQKELTAASIRAQEKERAQVGLELHDNVNQVLTTVKLYNELCRDGLGAPGELMEKSIRYLQDSINEIRSLSKRLSAPSLGDLSISASVKELISSIALTNKLDLSLDTAKIEHLSVNQELHLAVYRILQEHMTNIIRHAEAQKVEVQFDYSDDKLTLQVRDDGKGFDTRQKRKGIGITNMISRAESLNGTLTITSAPGQGCVLFAQLSNT